jgi:hypothetical protein
MAAAESGSFLLQQAIFPFPILPFHALDPQLAIGYFVGNPQSVWPATHNQLFHHHNHKDSCDKTICAKTQTSLAGIP